jgi:hypothetical protein
LHKVSNNQCGMCYCQPECELITQLIELEICIFIELSNIIHYVLHLRTKSYEITFTKTYSFKFFQQYKKGTLIFLIFFVLILNCSIFNNLDIVGLNISKPLECTPIHWKLSNHTKDTMGTTMVGRFQCNKPKNINFLFDKVNIPSLILLLLQTFNINYIVFILLIKLIIFLQVFWIYIYFFFLIRIFNAGIPDFN